MVCEDPGGAKCAGTQTASATGVTALSESFLEPLVDGDRKASLSFSIAPPIKHSEGSPVWGPSLLLARQAHKGAPRLRSYSVDWCTRHLEGTLGAALLCSLVCQSLSGPVSVLFSGRCWCVGREDILMAPPPKCESAVLPCFHGSPAFFHRYFPPQSPPSHPFSPSLCSQQQPSPWDCSTIPKLQLPVAAPSRAPVSLSGENLAVA